MKIKKIKKKKEDTSCPLIFLRAIKWLKLNIEHMNCTLIGQNSTLKNVCEDQRLTATNSIIGNGSRLRPKVVINLKKRCY